MMLQREEVVWLFRCLLGRDPESEEIIQGAIASHADLASARNYMLLSDEFMKLRNQIVGYRPEGNYTPATKSSRHRLGLAAIVKNERRHVEAMLNSCLPVVNHVVILDTGSTDDTREIALRVLSEAGCPFVLEDATFTDFAAARNSALDHVPDEVDWILMVDADERLAAEDYWRLLALLDADVDGWALPRYNFWDQAKSIAPRPYPDYQRRLFRNSKGKPVRYVNAVHELPANVSRWGYAPVSEPSGFIGGPHLHHMGGIDITPEQSKMKREFYEKLAVLA